MISSVTLSSWMFYISCMCTECLEDVYEKVNVQLITCNVTELRLSIISVLTVWLYYFRSADM